MKARDDASAPPVLHESAERALKYLKEQLSNGFSGKFTIEANRGGIRRFHEEKVLQSVDLDAPTPSGK